MDKRFEKLLEEISELENELREELQKQQDKFAYTVKRRKIIFDKEVSDFHRKSMVTVGKYLKAASFKNMLTAPVIWLCIFPAVFLDLVVSFYQLVCFPIYGIPRVKRGDYIIMDRKYLAYLNSIQKINCQFCAYFNGLIAYVQEIAARTEQYWCPIKHASRTKAVHSRYSRFIDYGDADAYHERFREIRKNFDDLKRQT